MTDLNDISTEETHVWQEEKREMNIDALDALQTINEPDEQTLILLTAFMDFTLRHPKRFADHIKRRYLPPSETVTSAQLGQMLNVAMEIKENLERRLRKKDAREELKAKSEA